MEELKFKLNIEECRSINDFVMKVTDNMSGKDNFCQISDSVTAMAEAVKIWGKIRKWCVVAKIADKEVSLSYRQVVLILRAIFKWQKFFSLSENIHDNEWDGLIKELASKISHSDISDEEELNSVIINNENKLREVAKESFQDEFCGLRTEDKGHVSVFLPWRNDGSDSLLSLGVEDFAQFIGTNIWFLQSLTQGCIEIEFAQWKDA